MLRNLLWTLLLLGATYMPICYGSVGSSVAYGIGANKTEIFRLGLQYAWCELCTANNKKFSGYWELAAERINANRIYLYPTTPNVQAGSISAVLRLKKKIGVPLYLDLGLGVAYFTKQSISKRQLGSNFLFEDRLGVGVLLGKKQQFEIGYRLLHYSNAYLASENNGLNLQLLVLGYWF